MASQRQRREAGCSRAAMLLVSYLLGLPNLGAAEAPPSAAGPAWTLGVAPGFAHFSQARSETRPAASPARDVFRLTLPCHVGAHGFGVQIEPALALGDVTALSMYLGPAFELAFGRVILRFGAGLWLGRNLRGGVYRDGFDVYGRLPISLAHRFGERLGLFVAVALALGATQVVGAARQREFQSASALDAAIGVWL
jgi:hypothetical protein